ncbi:MAG: CinA family nicotinamide mononucleotide deamidase-related protein [Nitrospinota bacterium]
MHKAEIISIGNELLSGKTIDTTSTFISRKLGRIGVVAVHKATIPDQHADIIKAVKQSLNRSSVLFITGGLGPTKDDITKRAVARVFGLKMKHYPQVEASIRQFYKKLHKKMPRLILNQAFLPEKSKPLKNSWGTAPGIYIKRQKVLRDNSIKKKMLFMLPGVPHETTNMFTHRVLPILAGELGKSTLNSVGINIFGIGESTIQEKLEKFQFSKDIKISYLPETGGVKLILTGDVPKKKLQVYSRKIQRLFKNNVFSTGKVTLEEALGKILKQKKVQLAIAESCTGGLLGSRVVSVSGASSYFAGGIIAYSNKVKTKLLGVSSALLKKYGAVSLPVAKAMAQGAAKEFSCECGIGITGVAGPTGSTRQKPIGYVCIASCCREKIITESFQFYGDRSFIRNRAAATALFQMFSLLKKN